MKLATKNVCKVTEGRLLIKRRLILDFTAVWPLVVEQLLKVKYEATCYFTHSLFCILNKGIFYASTQPNSFELQALCPFRGILQSSRQSKLGLKVTPNGKTFDTLKLQTTSESGVSATSTHI